MFDRWHIYKIATNIKNKTGSLDHFAIESIHCELLAAQPNMQSLWMENHIYCNLNMLDELSQAHY